MLKLAVCVSGGGTKLQALIDAIDSGRITNAQIEVVISNNAGAYALERAKNNGIKGVCISPKNFESREAFNEAFVKELDSYEVDLVVLAGFLARFSAKLAGRAFSLAKQRLFLLIISRQFCLITSVRYFWSCQK